MRTGYSILITFLFLCGAVAAPTFTKASGKQGQQLIDSLQALLKTNITDTIRVSTLNKLAWVLKFANPDTTMLLSTQAMNLAQKVTTSGTEGWERGIANSFRNMGAVNYLKRDYTTSLEYYFKALAINKKLNNLNGIAANLGNIGIVYNEQGDYPKALQYYFEALKIDKELDNKNGIARHLGNIGIVYRDQGDFPKALEYFFEALVLRRELGAKNLITSTLGNIGIVYGEQGETSKALEFFSEALKLSQELGYKRHVAAHLGNIGNVYEAQGEPTKALEYCFEALKISREIGDKRSCAINLGNIGHLYTQTGEFKIAESYVDSALTMSNSIGILSSQKDHHGVLTTLHDTLAQLAFDNGKWKEAALHYQLALEHNREFGTVKDSLFNEDKAKDIGRLEQRHETEIAEIQRNQEEAEARRQETEARTRRNNLQYSGILIMLVLVFAGVFILGRFNIPLRLAEGMIFFAFLLFFEFMLVMLDPYIENYSGGEPAYKLLFNAVLAGLIYPLHAFFESKMKERLVKTDY